METLFPRTESLEFRGMGTDLGLFIVVRDEAEYAQATADMISAREIYVRYEKIFSRFDPESELSRLNASLGKALPASREMLEVARHSLVYHKKYHRLFEPRIIAALEAAGYTRDFQQNDFTPNTTHQTVDISHPLEEDLIVSDTTVQFQNRMDFSGIVKGYTNDRVTEFFHSHGWTNFLIDSGGDMYAAGQPFDNDTWHIAIEGISTERLTLSLSDVAVATSGISRRKWERDGKRFHHLIHPEHPGNFAFDVKTVSVIASSTEEADVLAKVLFIQSDEERKKMAIDHNIATLVLSYNRGAWISPAAKPYRTSSNDILIH